jgi:competence protein ComGF
MYLRNEQGFTLLQVYIAFFLFLMIVSFVPSYFKLLFFQNNLINDQIKAQEAHLFFQQLTREVLESKGMSVSLNKIYLYKMNGDTVIYEKYGNVIRKRVNYRGHIVALQNVEFLQVQSVSNGCLLEVKFERGIQVKKRVSLLPEKLRASNDNE